MNNRAGVEQSQPSRVLVHTDDAVTLLGGGVLAPGMLGRALARAPVLVAADGGARHAVAAGMRPTAVVGDLDSLDPEDRASLTGVPIHHLPEQETTDFDKALRSIAAPLVLALGFAGGRLDHTLAAFNVLVRHAHRRCVLVDTVDLCFVAPRDVTLDLPAGTRVSLFPMGPVRGRSTGLRWPIDGRDFAPNDIIGTSNEATGGPVRLELSATRMLVLLPVAHLDAALGALG